MPSMTPAEHGAHTLQRLKDHVRLGHPVPWEVLMPLVEEHRLTVHPIGSVAWLCQHESQSPGAIGDYRVVVAKALIAKMEHPGRA